MTAIVFEGSRFNRSISHSDVKGIQDANSRDDVSSNWGKIKDWFCGTHAEDAKCALYDLLHGADDEIKLAGFNALYRLVSPPYQVNFDYTVLGGDEVQINIYSIGLEQRFNLPRDAVEAEVMSHIIDGCERLTLEQCVNQLELDIGRTSISFHENDRSSSYEARGGVSADEKGDRLTEFVSEFNEYQQRMLGILGSQTGTLGMMHYASRDPRWKNVGNTSDRGADIYKLNSGDIRVDISYRNQFPVDDPGDNTYAQLKSEENAYSAIDYSAIFIIGASDTVCLRAIFKGED